MLPSICASRFAASSRSVSALDCVARIGDVGARESVVDVAEPDDALRVATVVKATIDVRPLLRSRLRTVLLAIRFRSTRLGVTRVGWRVECHQASALNKGRKRSWVLGAGAGRWVTRVERRGTQRHPATSTITQHPASLLLRFYAYRMRVPILPQRTSVMNGTGRSLVSYAQMSGGSPPGRYE